jgi:hypothetical protein
LERETYSEQYCCGATADIVLGSMSTSLITTSTDTILIRWSSVGTGFCRILDLGWHQLRPQKCWECDRDQCERMNKYPISQKYAPRHPLMNAK